jgi:hypothetical protein
MARIPTERWSAEDLADGCGYCIVTRAYAERVMMAPAVAGGWIATRLPINYDFEVERAIRASGGHIRRWLDRRGVCFLAALPAKMMEGWTSVLSAADVDRIAKVDAERCALFERLGA